MTDSSSTLRLKPQLQQRRQLQVHQLQSTKGTESASIEARLALTGRYKIRPHSSPASSPLHERFNRKNLSAVMEEAWRGQCNYTCDPPDMYLLDATVILLQTSLKCVNDLAATLGMTDNPHTLPALLSMLDREEAHLRRASRNPEATNRDDSKSRRVFQQFKLIRQLVECLTQQSVASLEWRDISAAIYSQDSYKKEAEDWDVFSDKPSSVHDMSISEATSLIKTSDFPPINIGEAAKGSGWGSTEKQAERLEEHQAEQKFAKRLLWIRMILPSAPFFVACSGPAHMAAFLRLAEWKLLHMRLLPTEYHAKKIQQCYDPKQDVPTGINNMLIEVCCNPTSALQYEMSCICDTKVSISAAIIHDSDLYTLSDHISNLRRHSRPIIIHFSPQDISKLMLVLYLALLKSHKPLHMMALPSEVKNRICKIPVPAEVIHMLVEAIVDPSLTPNLLQAKPLVLLVV